MVGHLKQIKNELKEPFAEIRQSDVANISLSDKFSFCISTFYYNAALKTYCTAVKGNTATPSLVQIIYGLTSLFITKRSKLSVNYLVFVIFLGINHV